MSIGGGKSSSDSSNKSTSNTVGSSTYTPANSAALADGTKAGTNLLDSANWGNVAGAGANALTGALPGVTALNGTAQGAASSIAGGTTNGANEYLTPIANGSQVGNANPNFQSMIDQYSRALQPQIDGPMAAAGRYGSGADANAFASALTNKTGDLAYQNYTQGLTNQLTAAGQLGANNANDTNARLTAAGLTPGLTQSALAPGTTLTTAGTVVPLAAQGIFTMGNQGGTTNNSATTNASGSGSASTSNFNAGLNFGGS